jgi:hypothetical protein
MGKLFTQIYLRFSRFFGEFERRDELDMATLAGGEYRRLAAVLQNH